MAYFCLTLFAIVLVGLVAIYVLNRDIIDASDFDDNDSRVHSSRCSRAVSYIVKFGCILTAFGIFGALAGAAGASLAMAFPIPKPTKVEPSSWFDHSHNIATTIPFGVVVPVDWRPLLPGEKYKQNLSGFCRALALKAPVMNDIDLKFATFFVPYRLICDKTEDIVSKIDENPSLNSMVTPKSSGLDTASLNTIVDAKASDSFPFFMFSPSFRNRLVGGSLGGDVVDVPIINRSFCTGGLMDYLGFPTSDASRLNAAKPVAEDAFTSFPLSLAPMQAYHSICNHFFVDECHRRQYIEDGKLVNIHTELVGDVSSQISGDIGLHPGAGRYAPLFGLRLSAWESDYFTKATTTPQVRRIADASQWLERPKGDGSGLSWGFNADSIRGMFQLDEFARKAEMFFGDMRKQIKLMFGVKVSDRSAMSPILVDSGSAPVQVSELSNMAGDNTPNNESSIPLGVNGGKMTSGLGKSYDTFEPEEHGIIMTCVWLRPRTIYVDKVPHFFTSFLDVNSIPNPLFAQIGTRILPTREVSFDPFADTFSPFEDFGFTTPYVQYKYTLDSVTGDFRQSLIYWHCGRDFEHGATAGYEFGLINPDYNGGLGDAQSINRIFAVQFAKNGARPFQLQLRFETSIWQPYPHVDNEF